MVAWQTNMTKNPSPETTMILLFTRYPVAGLVKTRLIPVLGKDGAAQIHQRMTEYTLRQIIQTGFPYCICYTGGSLTHMESWLGEEHCYLPQPEAEFGKRLYDAFNTAFADGYKKVLLLGADCPDNRTDNILKAVAALDTHDTVFGAATDGGYYMIGLTKLQPQLFENIDWGTERVLQQSIAKISDYALLQELNDVDHHMAIPKKISVIVPTLNEETHIDRLVDEVSQGFHTELVFVDGGSTDATVKKASQRNVRVYSSTPNRAMQMNLGVQKATGDILLFLHADSSLPLDWDRHIRQALCDSAVSLGFFRFALQERFRGKRLIEWGTNIRAHILKRPYGDQGFFLRKKDFLNFGGYADVPLLEDIFFVQVARKHGKLLEIQQPLSTSARRWIRHGALKVTLYNQAILFAAFLGADLQELAQAYRCGNNPLKILFSKHLFSLR